MLRAHPGCSSNMPLRQSSNTPKPRLRCPPSLISNATAPISTARTTDGCGPAINKNTTSTKPKSINRAARGQQRAIDKLAPSNTRWRNARWHNAGVPRGRPLRV